jgi:hypothetical protein
MNTPPQTTAAPFNLAELEEAIANAAALAKQLTNDPHQSRSHVAAGVRSAIEHGAELVALQKQWAANNPVQA